MRAMLWLLLFSTAVVSSEKECDVVAGVATLTVQPPASDLPVMKTGAHTSLFNGLVDSFANAYGIRLSSAVASSEKECGVVAGGATLTVQPPASDPPVMKTGAQTSIFDGVVDSFANAYGIRPEGALGILVSLAFVAVSSMVLPTVIRLALSSSAGPPTLRDDPHNDTSSAAQPVSVAKSTGEELPIDLNIVQQLSRLSDENRALRAELHRWTERLEANERLGAALKHLVTGGGSSAN